MSAYFLASNGLLYRDPIIRGNGWFVVFDGEDEPELVLAKSDGSRVLDATAARLAAVSILEQAGISAVLSGVPRSMRRAFDASGDGARDSWCFWLSVEEPIPVELLTEPERAAGVSEPPGEALVQSFGQPWGALA